MVCRWLGNSPGVARKHYLQVTDEHFAKAAGVTNEGAARVGELRATRGNAHSNVAMHEMERNAGNGPSSNGPFSGNCAPLPSFATSKIAEAGVELPFESAQNAGVDISHGANCGAELIEENIQSITHAELKALRTQWKTLPVGVRAAINRIILTKT